MRPPTTTPVDSGSMLANSTVQGASEIENMRQSELWATHTKYEIFFFFFSGWGVFRSISCVQANSNLNSVLYYCFIFCNNIAVTYTNKSFILHALPLKIRLQFNYLKPRSHLHPQIHFLFNELSFSQFSQSLNEKWSNNLPSAGENIITSLILSGGRRKKWRR